MLFFLSVPLLAWGQLLRRRAKSHLIDVRGKLLETSKDPVLYLRPFMADSEEFSNSAIKEILSEIEESFINEEYDVESWEERLASSLSGVGPLLAVGKPGETVSPLGAWRIYFADREWQAGIRYLMSISQLVIIHAGGTTGLQWELVTAKEEVDPTKLLVSFLHWEEDDAETRQQRYRYFRSIAEETLMTHLPQELDRTILMSFGPNWEPIPIQLGWGKRLLFAEFLPTTNWRQLFMPKISPTTIREAMRKRLKEIGLQVGAAKTLSRLALNFIAALTILLISGVNGVNGVIVVTLSLVSFLVTILVFRRFEKTKDDDRPVSIIR